MKKTAVAIRFGLAAINLAVVVFLVGNHKHAGIKGMPIPLEQVVICIVFAALAGFACARFWRSLPAPFVAGIAGAASAGPYGGLLGFCVGLLVAILVGGRDRSLRTHTPPKQIA